MRILFIFHRPDRRRGYTEERILPLARAAQHAGHSAWILACVSTNSALPPHSLPHELPGAVQTMDKGGPVILLPQIASNDDGIATDDLLTERIAAWIRHQKFDIVHLLHPMRTAFAVQAVLRCALPLVVSLTDFSPICPQNTIIDADGFACSAPRDGERRGNHSLCRSWSADDLEKRVVRVRELLAVARIRICPSPYAAARFQKTFPDLDFTVVPHGLDPCFFLPWTVIPVVKTTGLTLGYVDDISSNQGLATLIRAFSSVPDPHLRLLVSIDDAPDERDEVRQLIDADPRVQVYTSLTPQEVADFLSSLDCLCLPWETETACTTILDQAAAASVPALVTDLGALGEWVARYGCGQALPMGADDAWAQAIAGIVAHPRHLKIWQANLPLPLRIEEETFFHESLYRRCLHPA